MSTTREINYSQCCSDCLVFIANGDTPPELSETETAAWLAEVTRRSEGVHVMCSSWPDVDWTDEDRDRGADCEGSFSWSQCDWCGSMLGGDRYPVAWWPIEPQQDHTTAPITWANGHGTWHAANDGEMDA